MSFWAVVETEAQREHMARLLIMRLGYETYLPRIKHRSRITPLFPRYLFVRIIDRWYPVRWTPHVLRILMPGDCPAPDAKLENSLMLIRKQERAGLVKLPTATQVLLKKGQQVRITGGSFAGQIGIYEGMSGKDRERVLLNLLGQAVPVDLPSKDVAPLNVASPSRLRY